jgi:hypothetical protein
MKTTVLTSSHEQLHSMRILQQVADDLALQESLVMLQVVLELVQVLRTDELQLPRLGGGGERERKTRSKLE